ncbi:P-loop NTPase fold protein [Streptomyces sp. NBC_00878]|uniref:P-loop NTPase fold protein n=1 Tax=Streptomyces sp. NBC_00878 TaxID=2975854 RepID=UPI00224F13C0|nr:P-loop NTPase fold protein [Streptomyces sp. NBC_00878]MCX4905801.1 P-loop NTPase fold protein [Streptomyces sp. NBC_00878]
MDFSLLNDEPVTDPEVDVLGTGRAARELAKLLHDSRTATPFTLAVDAGWGMGKSSLMRLVQAELLKRRDVETVWYNAWTSTGADALEGLIKSVLLRFDKRMLRRAMHRVSERGTLIRAVRATLTVASVPFGVAGLVDQFWRDMSVNANARNEMRVALRDLATEWAESAEYEPSRLLVVFVDDLDRCSEETVLAVCEAVKVYLDVPGLVFVIGCDRSALGPSGLLRDLGPAGSAFMEKVFQTSYRLPVPGGDEVEAYVRHCAERSGLRELLDDDLVKLIAARSARNPRRIKRLINGFGLECALNPLWESFRPEAVIRTLLLQHLYGDFYRLLVSRDGTYTHAAQEFREYRAARRVLSEAVRPDPESWRTTVNSVKGHGLAEPDMALSDGWAAVLARLEEELPTSYPALARDHNFVHLVEEWMRLPQVDELVQHLQKGGVAPVVLIRDGDEAPSGGDGTSAEGRGTYEGFRTYEGLRVLWVDDNPGGNRRFIGDLTDRGADVVLAESARSAEQILRTQTFDLLLSDVTRGSDRDAGFTDLARWRQERRFDGPVVFFTGRVTPARERRSQELGARIAASGRLLFLHIDAACEEIRHRRS